MLIYPEDVPVVIDELQFRFGRPEMLVKSQIAKIKEFPKIAYNRLDQIRLDQIQSLWEKVGQEYETASKAALREGGSGNLPLLQNKYEHCYAVYERCASKLNEDIDRLSVSTSPARTAPPTETFSKGCSLPPCDTEIFDGDYLRWPTFRDLFTVIYMGTPAKPMLKIDTTAFVLPNLAGNLPTSTIDRSILDRLPNMPLADPSFLQPSQIDLLLSGWRPNISIESGATMETHLTKFWEVEDLPCRLILRREIYSIPAVKDSEHIDLGHSRSSALAQYLRNETRLKKEPALKDTYDSVIQEYIDLGHMKPVPPNTDKINFYLPHHAVFKPESATTKVREVFNASSPSSNGNSLNDILYPGPVLQSDLTLQILKWRTFKFVFNADITKMYRQILLNQEHTPFQRILFRNGQGNISDFELQTVTFGVNCAPFLALRTLQQLSDDVNAQYQRASHIISNYMYVDDVLAGAHTEAEAILAIQELQAALTSAGFPLCKWTSNERALLKALPKEHLLSTDFLDLEEVSTTKTLGVRWNATTDEFYFVPTEVTIQANYSKRDVLSQIAKLFDPAGWLSPFVVQAKILMQDIWLASVEWDEFLPADLLHRWHDFLRSYSFLHQVRIPRWVHFQPGVHVQIHGFCDASQKAYGAAIYFRIQSLRQWSHMRSEHNPADLARRGVTAEELATSELWWHGPSWLTQQQDTWPAPYEPVSDIDIEKRLIRNHLACPKQDMFERFYKLDKALRAFAYVQRFIQRSQKRPIPGELQLSNTEISTAERLLIFMTQRRYFALEYACLSQKRPIPASSSIKNMNPFLDPHGLIRACGRVTASEVLQYDERHPIFLPYNCQLARLLVSFTHRISLHGGNQLMVRLIRPKFWIPRVMNLVKSVIFSCKICVIHKKKLPTQLMGELPKERTSFSRLFTYTGMDYAGPFDIKNYTGRACLITKGYVLVFVCFSTKAIHLEPTSYLTTEKFLAAFARFVSRRGCPRQVQSDNGKTFVGAAAVLSREFLQAVKESVTNAYSHQELLWQFIPPRGLWEAGVKSFKTLFYKSTATRKYTFEELSALLAKIEASLNSRPLAPMSEGPTDLLALTPGHFLVGGPLLATVEPEIKGASTSIINRWQHLKAFHQQFRLRWKEEYLKELHKRTKWQVPTRNLEVGEMVIIKDDNLPSNEWRLGRIDSVFPGPDGHVRGVPTGPSVATLLQRHSVNLLPTALRVFDTAALIDPCTPVSCIDSSLAASLRLATTAVGGEQICSATVGSKTNAHVRLDLVFKVRTPIRQLDETVRAYFKDITLADKRFYLPATISVVLGADVYPKVMQHGFLKVQDGLPVAQRTVFGWVLSGACHTP
nr:uncharacterized protein LOC121503298 [Drosophila kikkawai]